jgi:CRISPR-associated protein Cmr4
MSYKHLRYLLMTLDPTHIGAGGYRLGRVDNSIIREPGTNLPKIPGTSLSGALRSYAAYRYDKVRCAGQGQGRRDDQGNNIPGHCGRDTCPICYTFGYTVGEQSRAGTVNPFDAHIILFPAHSMIGPVWISTKRRLEDFGFGVAGSEPNELPGEESFVITQEPNAPATAPENYTPLNLGWLMLPVSGRADVTPPVSSSWADQREWSSIRERIVLVPETLLSQIINANLEVRTSVSIDPTTGAAQRGALFTYEAIPRAAFLVFDLIQDDYRNGINPWSSEPVVRTAAQVNGEWIDNAPEGRPLYPDLNDHLQPLEENGEPKGWREPCQVVHSGLEWAAALGVGGMGTRGFGRLGLIGEGYEVQSG